MRITPFKIRVTPEQSTTVQQSLLSQGVRWVDGSTEVKNTNEEYMIVSRHYLVDHIGIGSTTNKTDFLNSRLSELTFDQFNERYGR